MVQNAKPVAGMILQRRVGSPARRREGERRGRTLMAAVMVTLTTAAAAAVDCAMLQTCKLQQRFVSFSSNGKLKSALPVHGTAVAATAAVAAAH